MGQTTIQFFKLTCAMGWHEHEARSTNDDRFICQSICHLAYIIAHTCYVFAGGVHLKFRSDELFFFNPADADNETDVRRKLDKFMIETMKVCWRLKRHPLEQDTNHVIASTKILHGVIVPLDDLICKVLNKIEEECRRVVAVDMKDNSLVVYCPTRDSLRNLWAMTERINRTFMSIIAPKDCNKILYCFGLSSITNRVYIEGPEFLEHSQILRKREHWI